MDEAKEDIETLRLRIVGLATSIEEATNANLTVVHSADYKAQIEEVGTLMAEKFVPACRNLRDMEGVEDVAVLKAQHLDYQREMIPKIDNLRVKITSKLVAGNPAGAVGEISAGPVAAGQATNKKSARMDSLSQPKFKGRAGD